MGVIEFDPAEVRKAAAQLKNSASKLNDKLWTLKDIENEIGAAWKSRYTSQYIDCLERTEEKLRRAKERIYSSAQKLNSLANAAESTEKEIERSIRGSGGGGGGSW